jgi:hypothetical protein
MPNRITILPAASGHSLVVGLEAAINLTDDDLLRLSRQIPAYFREFLASKHQTGQRGKSPIAPIPVTTIKIDEDLHQTQIRLSIEDLAGGKYDCALSPEDARQISKRLIAVAARIEAASQKRTSN